MVYLECCDYHGDKHIHHWVHFGEVKTATVCSNSSSLLLIPVLGWQVETLYSQADSLSAHEAIACVCES